MEDNKVPYIVYEGTIARFERTVRRLIIVLAVTILLLFASNALWIYEWNQYDYSDVTVDSQDGGNANYMGVGASGVINNGEGKSKDKD
jgi:heme/copper-type cytochrome/quinol oxidase subunit 3